MTNDTSVCRRCGHDPSDELTRLDAAVYRWQQRRRNYHSARTRYVRRFEAAWNAHPILPGTRQAYPLPDQYARSIKALHTAGLPAADLVDAVEITMNATTRHPNRFFRYFLGVAWNKVNAMRAEIRGQLEESS